MRRQRAIFILRPETDVDVLPQGRVERCSLYLVAYSSPIAIAELVKTAHHALRAPLWPEDYYEERYRERVLQQLSQRAQKLGMQLVAAEQPT